MRLGDFIRKINFLKLSEEDGNEAGNQLIDIEREVSDNPQIDEVKVGTLSVALYQKVMIFNSLPNKIFDWFKLKAFADEKMNMTRKIENGFGKCRKHCGKRRKCWLPAFSPFSTMFQKSLFLRVVKSWDCVVKGQ